MKNEMRPASLLFHVLSSDFSFFFCFIWNILSLYINNSLDCSREKREGVRETIKMCSSYSHMNLSYRQDKLNEICAFQRKTGRMIRMVGQIEVKRMMTTLNLLEHFFYWYHVCLNELQKMSSLLSHKTEANFQSHYAFRFEEQSLEEDDHNGRHNEGKEPVEGEVKHSYLTS